MDLRLNDSAKAALVGAFFGAIAAFILGRFSDFLRSINRGRAGHHNALVSLEHLLAEHGGIWNDNIYIASGFKKALGNGNLYWSRMAEVPIERKGYIKLQDLTLLNQVISYNKSIRKLNDDVRSIQNGYGRLERAVMGGKIHKEEYIVNAGYLVDGLSTLEAFTNNILETELIEILCRVRILIKRSSSRPRERLKRLLLLTSKDVSKDDISNEKKAIEKEIDEIRKTSKVKIEKMKLAKTKVR